jgi:hypothetical protein
VIELPGIGRASDVEIVTHRPLESARSAVGNVRTRNNCFRLFQASGPSWHPAFTTISTSIRWSNWSRLPMMAAVPGVGARRAFAIKGALTDRLGHRHFKRPAFPWNADGAAAGCGPGVSVEGGAGPSTQDRPSTSIGQEWPGYSSSMQVATDGSSPCSFQTHKERMNWRRRATGSLSISTPMPSPRRNARLCPRPADRWKGTGRRGPGGRLHWLLC